ncbi:MAG: trehalose-phosphatase [Rubrivivax sp.]
MQHLFTPEGEAALAALLRRRPLFGFDFDGTLAPIVAEPAAARIPPAVTGRLRLLAELAPVVVISGRAIDDLRRRLGFEPRHVVGSHGAEDPLHAPEATAGEHAAALDPLREHLRAHAGELAAAGVDVEDKRQSIALHYRRAAALGQARSLIERLLEDPPGRPTVFAGKLVYNATAPGAPDKAGALQKLLRRCDADCAIFAGDDVNDEPVFAAAPADWVTVHVGRGPSQARFYIDGPRQMVGLLERALRGLRAEQD